MEIWYNWAYSTKILTRNTKNKWSLYYNITSHTIFKITVIQFHTLDNICWIILCVCLVFSYHFPNLNLKLLWSFTAGSIGYGCWWERKWQIMPYVNSSCIIIFFLSNNFENHSSHWKVMGNLRVTNCFFLHPSLCWPKMSFTGHILKITGLKIEEGYNLISGTLWKAK